MTSLDLRVGALSLLGNPGTSRTLRLIFTADGDPVTPGPVSVWIGGDERHPNDFTGATEHPAAVAGNEATVTVPIPAGRELLRLTLDGVLATVGHVAPSLRGTPDQDQTVSVNLGAVEMHLDLAAVPIDLEQRLAGKFATVVNVLGYGAKGDGTTDDTAAIQAAVDAAVGGICYLPPGTYRISATINVPSHVTIAGAGRYVTTILPDAGTGDWVFEAYEQANVWRESIEIRDLGIDGRNYPDPDEPFGRIRAAYVRGLRIHGIYSVDCHDTVNLRAVEDFQISGLHVVNNRAGMVSFLADCKRGTVTDVIGEQVSEGMDFYECEDIVVSGVRATGYVNEAHMDEAFDISSSRRITIENALMSGFYRGVNAKIEGGASEDITIRDCEFRGFVTHGVLFAAAAGNKRPRVSRVKCFSSEPGSIGILVASLNDDAVIEDCHIEVEDAAIFVEANTRPRITGNFAKGKRPIRLTGQTNGPMVAPVVAGNVVESVAGTTSQGAVEVNINVNDPVVRDNRVVGASGVGIYINNCRRPVVTGNVIDTCSQHGIHVVWNNATYVDTTRFVLGAAIERNRVKNWGTGSSNRTGILVSVIPAGLTDEFFALRICDNDLFLDNNVANNSQQGIIVTKNAGAASVDYVKLTGNSVYDVPATNPIVLTALGANSVTTDNLTKGSRPA